MGVELNSSKLVKLGYRVAYLILKVSWWRTGGKKFDIFFVIIYITNPVTRVGILT